MGYHADNISDANKPVSTTISCIKLKSKFLVQHLLNSKWNNKAMVGLTNVDNIVMLINQ
jgi:hypothetical protein